LNYKNRYFAQEQVSFMSSKSESYVRERIPDRPIGLLRQSGGCWSLVVEFEAQSELDAVVFKIKSSLFGRLEKQ
jgi:hypothetical protein